MSTKHLDISKLPVSLARSDTPFAKEKFPHLLHNKVQPMATYSPWLNDHAFVECYTQIEKNTLVDVYRCYELWSLVKQLGPIAGNILEVGVWQGGTGALLAAAAKAGNTDRTIYLADTFEGVVKAGDKDSAYRGGEHADTSIDIVQDLLKKMQLEAVLLQGIFPEATSDQVQGPIAFLHCDVDVYQSSKDIVEWVLPQMPSGGIIVFDDYGFYGCEGVTNYVQELQARDDFTFLHNLNGHAIFIRR